jgi:P pilus assembly chaperone PapD
MELNGSEQAYRLYLREISSKDDVSKGKVQVLLRVGIPVFVKTRDKNTPIIQWNVTCDRDHHLMLSAHNTGNVHLKVIEIALSDASQKKLFVKKMSHYILSGTKRSWSFEIDACPKIGTKFKLSALTNVGRIDANPVAQ